MQTETPRETTAMGEMLALLQQLDERQLKKAMEIIQVAFLD